MSVCQKHKRAGRRSCDCRTSSTVAGNGYGGPDFTDVAVTVASYDSGPSHDPGPSGGDSGSVSNGE